MRKISPSKNVVASPASLAEPDPSSQRFQWWYRIASPAEPPNTAPFEARERFRRGRTGSKVVFAVFIIYLAAFPAAFSRTDHTLVTILSAGVLALILAIILNRLGYVTLAGIIVVAAITASPVTDILTIPGGLSVSVIPIYSILVLPLMCAVSFLPAWWVFIVALGNSLFILYTAIFMPHTAEIDAALKKSSIDIVTPIILSQLIISVVAYIWVMSAVRALRRADRAEEIANLEHQLAVSAETAMQQKEQLEAGIQKIVETHTRVANGDFNARAPIAQDNVLWQVSSSLNTFLSRMQRSRQEAQQARIELEQLREEVRMLRSNQGKKNN